MLTSVSWPSMETSPRLLPQEIEVLANFCFQMSEFGQLSNGKFKGASVPLYWVRLKGIN